MIRISNAGYLGVKEGESCHAKGEFIVVSVLEFCRTHSLPDTVEDSMVRVQASQLSLEFCCVWSCSALRLINPGAEQITYTAKFMRQLQ